MATQLKLGEISDEVVKKDIKNVHLSVYPPDGRVRIAAPSRMSLDTIRLFAISRLGWIKQQQKELREQERETARENLDRESHFLWGKRYLLQVMESEEPPSIELKHSRIWFRIRPGTPAWRKQEIMEEWYRERIKQAASPLIAQWEATLGVKVEKVFVQRMKTRWGSCNAQTGNVRLNTELAKKPPECLEYIIVHEMTHLLEPTHKPRFIALLDRVLPKWQFYRDLLNRLPVRHEDWVY